MRGRAREGAPTTSPFFLRWLLALLFALLPVTHGLAQSAAPPAPDAAAQQAQRQQTQPANNAPFWRQARSANEFSTQIQNIEAGVLINPGGESWRAIRNDWLTFWGGWLLIAVPLAILAFYFTIGPLRTHAPLSGRKILRFTQWERAVHWLAAIAFLVMAATGLIILFGKYYLLVLLSYPVFSWLAKLSISLHNFTAPLFVASLVMMFFSYRRRNSWRSSDTEWVKRGGGLVSKREPRSGFFNAGEKLWFWSGVVALGIVMTVSGAVLLFPVYNQTRNVLALADIVHILGALAYIVLGLGHIYMGTIGQSGVYRAMRDGYVDETWAKEHHPIWYEDMKAGRVREPEDAPLVALGERSDRGRGEAAK